MNSFDFENLGLRATVPITTTNRYKKIIITLDIYRKSFKTYIIHKYINLEVDLRKNMYIDKDEKLIH